MENDCSSSYREVVQKPGLVFEQMEIDVTGQYFHTSTSQLMTVVIIFQTTKVDLICLSC